MGPSHAGAGDPAARFGSSAGVVDPGAARGRCGANGGAAERVINAEVFINDIEPQLSAVAKSPMRALT